MSGDAIKEKMVEAIKEGRMEEGEEIVKSLIDVGIDPLEALDVVTDTLRQVGDAFGRGELFLVHMMMSAETAKIIISVLTPELKRKKKEVKYIGRVLIGTVAGDIHDIGKSLVATFLRMENFEVIDLGIDIPTKTFVEKVRELEPDVLGLSALVTSTMPVQGEVIEALRKAGLRDKVKVIVGGSSVTSSWAEEIRADDFGADAIDAVAKIKALIGKTK
jgi:trimethylamine corrinoid protein